MPRQTGTLAHCVSAADFLTVSPIVSSKELIALPAYFIFYPSLNNSIATDDLDDNEQTVVNTLLASQEETIHQQRTVIKLQKEKIRLLEELLHRHDLESHEEGRPNSADSELVDGLRLEVSMLRSMTQRLLERQVALDARLEELTSSAGYARCDSDVTLAPNKKARSEE